MLSLHAQVWGDSLIKAQEFYKNKEFNKSNEIYSKAEVSSGEDLSFQKERAQSAYRSEDFDAANEAYELALRQETNSKKQSEILYNQGNTYCKRGEYEAAIDKYKAAILKNQNNQEAKYNLSQVLRQKNSQSSSQKEKQDQSESENNQKTKNRDTEKKQDFSLEKQVADRTLDELLKKAQATKRKLANQKTKSSKNNKDW